MRRPACWRGAPEHKPLLVTLPPAGATILPVLSAAIPRVSLPEAQARALMARIQDAGTEVVKVGGGEGRWGAVAVGRRG